ncbi:MAG TPA: amidohydrolase, partial [Sphingobacterium sp.]|nr:amidohydrolase [Sphingobacterium sp.]
MRIDTHQHFWKFDPIRDSWITEEMQVIRRDFTPLDIQFVLERNGF